MTVSNAAKYYYTRVLQKMGLAALTLKIAERSRCIIPDPPLATKAFAFEATTRDFLSDPTLQSVLELTKTARTFWDVGANMGFYSILARDQNPDLQVVSIEACTDHYQVLCRNWMLNPNGWICLHVAVGDSEGLVQMKRRLGGFDHVLSEGERAGAGSVESRPMLMVDHIAQLVGHEGIDVLKIDVEGMELPVLRGAARMLEEGRIGTVILEADGHEARYGMTNDQLVSFLATKNYRLKSQKKLSGSGVGSFQVFQRGIY